tara:strand:+ start:2241 stop:2462 length:222 start_codon:yes stop_codon:yes gene_type:complete
MAIFAAPHALPLWWVQRSPFILGVTMADETSLASLIPNPKPAWLLRSMDRDAPSMSSGDIPVLLEGYVAFPKV